MIRKIIPILTAVLAMGAGTLAAQQGGTVVTVHEAKPGLLAQAAVKSDAAQAAVAKEVKTAKVVSGQIEERASKLVYVYKVAGKNGKTREVVVDAKTGVVVKPMRTASSGGRRNPNAAKPAVPAKK
jgi:uncharacterized membrane protein YkoI